MEGRKGGTEGGRERHIHTENCLSKFMQTESKLTEFKVIRNLMSPNPTEISAASPIRRHSHLLTVMRPAYFTVQPVDGGSLPKHEEMDVTEASLANPSESWGPCFRHSLY